MVSLQQIESDLVSAMKAKDQIAVDTLRGLKTRIQNQKVSKMADLSGEEIEALVRSEVKRRKEASESFKTGGRMDQSDKEMEEAGILEKYLPAQMPEEQIAAIVEEVISSNSYTASDFGKAMGALKVKAGSSADGAVLARILKEKLK
jgi:uncharacterized protein